MTRKWLLGLLLIVPIGAFSCGDEEEGSGDPCESTADCPSGEVCEDGTCVLPDGGGDYYTQNLGTLEVMGGGSTPYTLTIPEGTQSVALLVDGLGNNLALAEKIDDPSGATKLDFFEGGDWRTDAGDGLYILFFPNDGTSGLAAGDWNISFFNDGSTFTADITGVFRGAPASANTLDMNLFFVGVDGLDAAMAESSPEFQKILSDFEAVYQGAGISLGTVTYNDITGDDADRYSVVDTTAGELEGLFNLSSGQSNRAINFFFVADITGGDAGFSLLGLSGGVPGPPGVHGTDRSGLAVNMASFIEAVAAGDADMIASAQDEVEIIMAHEGGHYLGLYHTTERNGQALDPEGITGSDPLGDTPVCADSSDGNGNGSLSASECSGSDGGNLMFWSPANDSRDLTSSQGTVLTLNPLIK